MAIFCHLNDNAFLLFSGKNRHFYAEVLLGIYEEFYDGRSLNIPLRRDVQEAISQIARRRRDLWGGEDDAPSTDPTDIAKVAYKRLLECGWLEEEPHGFTAIVEMPPAPMLLTEHLRLISTDLSHLFGGVIVSVYNNMRPLRESPRANALGLQSSSQAAQDFVRRLRSILSSMRAVGRQIMASGTSRARIGTLFEDFVRGIMVRDYKAIFSYSHHPLRHRGDIVRLAHEMKHDESVLNDIAEGYLENNLVDSLIEGRALAEDQLQVIVSAFNELPTYINHIDRFRTQLERRLRNTLRYIDRSDDRVTLRLAGMMKRMAALETRAGELEVNTELIARPRIMGQAGFFKPRAPRTPIKAQRAEELEEDPVEEYRILLLAAFDAMMDPSDSEIADFLSRQAREGARSGTDLKIGSLADFAIFERAMEMAHDGGKRLGQVALKPGDGIVDNGWLKGPDFIIEEAEQ